MKKELRESAIKVLNIATELEKNGSSAIGQNVPSILKPAKEPYPAELVCINADVLKGEGSNGKWHMISVKVAVDGLKFNASASVDALQKLTEDNSDKAICKVQITESKGRKFASVI